MSTTKESAIVELGLSTTKISDQFQTFRHSFKHQIGDLAKEFGGAFAAGGILAGIEHLLTKFDDLKDRAENLEISTDFLQGLQHIAGKDAVGGTETFNRAIGELANKLGAAKEGSKEAIATFEKFGITLSQIESLNTEEMFYQIADKIKATEDPAIRVTEAFELMGKSGKNLVGVLANGSESLKNMVDQVDKLDIDKIKALAEAKERLEDIENTVTTGAGRALGWIIKDVPGFLGRLTAGGDPGNEGGLRAAARKSAAAAHAELLAKGPTSSKEERDHQQALQEIYQQIADVHLPKIDKLKREASQIEFRTRDLSLTDIERGKASLALAKKKQEITEEEVRLEKIKTDEKKNQDRLDKATADKHQHVVDLGKQLANSRDAEFMPTLDELAARGIYQRDARRLQFLQKDVVLAKQLGNTNFANRELQEIQAIRGRLSAAGVYQDPNQTIVDELKKAQEETQVVIKTMG